jgi:hypothetical protein
MATPSSPPLPKQKTKTKEKKRNKRTIRKKEQNKTLPKWGCPTKCSKSMTEVDETGVTVPIQVWG